MGFVVAHLVEFQQELVEYLLRCLDEDDLEMRVLEFSEAEIVPESLGIQVHGFLAGHLHLHS